MTRIGYVGRGLFSAAFFLLSACSTQLPKLDPSAPPPPASNELPTFEVTTELVQTNDPDGRLHVWTLPVGAGNCQVVTCPRRDAAGFKKLLVMDCGALPSGRNPNFQVDRVSEAINGMIDGATKVVVTVSHPDQDHYNYISEVLKNVPVSAVYLALNPNDYTVGNFGQWVKDQQKVGAQLRYTNVPYATGIGIEEDLSCQGNNGWGGNATDVEGRILAMNASGTPGTTSNNASMVVSMKYGLFQTLFTGDMTQVTEGLIANLSAGWPLNSQVVTGAHHGAISAGSNSASWAQKTSPQAFIFSSGKRYKHPRCESIQNYLDYGLRIAAASHSIQCSGGLPGQSTLPVFLTQTNGMIHYSATNDGSFNLQHEL
ncbi:ComEC/Rec2 family competence protein [Xanthomonas campestris]|uniref:ComEC/Rec2 family competence protein n=1 Tax=Xanthomonas campestris TaxID=339 RepID=UPI0011C3B551|nr:hypothetical protein [Xanthomonas campestris]